MRPVHTVTSTGALFGRESELTMLVRLIADAVDGRGSAVLIDGEQGIGKSALVRAAVAEGPGAGCEVFWGAGDELGQALPLLPMLDALRVREPSANARRETIVRLTRELEALWEQHRVELAQRRVSVGRRPAKTTAGSPRRSTAA